LGKSSKQEEVYTDAYFAEIKSLATTWTPVESYDKLPLKDQDMFKMLGSLDDYDTSDSSLLSGVFQQYHYYLREQQVGG
jgi:hypothetical protein